MAAVNRRRWLKKTLMGTGALAAANPVEAQQEPAALPPDTILRGASALHGSNLPGERLQALQPVWERRLTPLRTLRSFEVDDSTGLTVKL